MKTYFLDVLKNQYADVEGCATRTQYWMFTLWWMLILVILLGLMTLGESIDNQFLAWTGLIGSLVFSVFTLVPNVAIAVRRLHDINFSGWWYLLNLINPGGLVLLIFYCLPTVLEGNRYQEVVVDEISLK